MIRIDFHVNAEAELDAAVSFYESVTPGLGKAFVADAKNAITLLKSNPDAGLNPGRKLRKLRLKRFPFSLIYQHEAQRILILAVAHHRRRPDTGKVEPGQSGSSLTFGHELGRSSLIVESVSECQT